MTALAFVLIIGKADRFRCGKQVASYLGLVPLEDSSGQSATARPYHQTRQLDCCASCWWRRRRSRCAVYPEWRSKYFHLAMRRGRKIAKVAMARRLAVRLYWMMRKGWDYEQLKKFGSQGRKPGPHAREPTASTR